MTEMTETPTLGEKGTVEKLGGMQDIHDWVLCPISYSIFRNPVLAEDGYIYEHDCIFRWFTECRNSITGLVSPLTKEKLKCSRLIPCQMSRQMVAQYLALFPEKQVNQYVCTFDMKTLLCYFYDFDVILGEQYLRNIETISLEKDITFQDMMRCVKIIDNKNPLLRTSFWECFFRKIEDIHGAFKNERNERNDFSFGEEVVMEIGSNESGETWTQISNTLGLRRLLDLEDEELEQSISRLSLNNMESNDLETESDDSDSSISEETATVPLENTVPNLLTIDVEEVGEEEGEVVESNALSMMRNLHRHNNRMRESIAAYGRNLSIDYKRRLLGCLCFQGNKCILETFLNFMPKITCREIANRYSTLIEDFIKRQNLTPQKARKMKFENIERLQNIIILMIDKGIPYFRYTTKGKETLLSMLYFYLDPFYPGTFSKLQRKLINLPEFFHLPEYFHASPDSENRKSVARRFFKKIMDDSESFYMTLNVWEIYQESNIVELDDIWEFCVKHSRHNIWNEEELIRNSFYEKVLFDFIKKRGSIPMELVLLHTFSSGQLNHLFIEGFQIENKNNDKTHSFPKHEHILPPIMNEDFVFLINSARQGCLKDNTKSKLQQKWKVDEASSGGRLLLSRNHSSTKWTWDHKKQKTGEEEQEQEGKKPENCDDKNTVIQSSPVLSILGWLIHHYDAPIVHQYLIQNKELEIDVNSDEYTGLEHVNPIHLIFRKYNHSKEVDKLLTEMIRRGVKLHTKTSHGWLPIHYACRYSPKLIKWILENIPEKETYINDALCYHPSSQTIKIFQYYREWNKTYLPLELFIKNNTTNEENNDIMKLLISSGAKNQNQIKSENYLKEHPFVVDHPVVFELGSGEGNEKISRKRK